MQPPEPAQPGTSLELAFEPNGENRDGPASSAELELPTSAVPPSAPEAPEPAEASAGSGAPGPLGDLVAAHFRRVEVAMLGRVLIDTLAGALPASMIRLERRRSLGRRLLGRTGEPIGITITAADRTLTFRAPQVGVAEASAGHTVRGVVLSSTPMPVAQWLDELGALLDQVTRDDEDTRAALERAFQSW
jgi:hypothetical protein